MKRKPFSLRSLTRKVTSLTRKGRSRPVSNPHEQLAMEQLEGRVLLSTIAWTNRGNANNDSDGFNGVFAGNATTARGVVDAALLSWQNVIASFNYVGGNLNDTYQITVNMQASGTSLGASAGPTKGQNGKPSEGAAMIGRGNDGPDVDTDVDGDGRPDAVGDGLGWFLDPTPQESSEFLGTINNAFSGQAPTLNPDGTPNPIASQADLYSVVLHEFGHALVLCQP